MHQIRAIDLAKWTARPDGANLQIVDVREPWELQICMLPGSRHIPMREIPQRMQELDPQRAVVCVCHLGARSQYVAAFLERNGFNNVFNLSGGVTAWTTEVDPSFPTY